MSKLPICPPAGPFIRSARTNYPYPKTLAEGRRVSLDGFEPSITKQAGLHEADVNNVILRFAGSGVLPTRLNPKTPIYEDVSEIGDLHSTLSKARTAYDQVVALREAAESEAARAAVPDPEGAASAPGSSPSSGSPVPQP